MPASPASMRTRHHGGVAPRAGGDHPGHGVALPLAVTRNVEADRCYTLQGTAAIGRHMDRCGAGEAASASPTVSRGPGSAAHAHGA